MKTKVFLLAISIFFAAQLFAQANRNISLQKKTVATGRVLLKGHQKLSNQTLLGF